MRGAGTARWIDMSGKIGLRRRLIDWWLVK